MNEFDSDMPMMGEVMTRDASGFSMPQAAVNQGDVAPYGGAALIQTTNRNVTAQRVAVARSLPSIMREIREYCAQFGDTYVYAWDAKDRQKGGKATIEGGTIKMAMMLQQVFGNCSVDMDVSETPTHLIFKAWFTDFEKGTQLSRLFQQRKGQNTGMGDKERQADIIFQIGQSKAARNVILNALASFAAYALEESKRGMLAKLESPEAKETAWAFIDATLARHSIDIKRLEALIGRSQKEFTIRDLAKAYMLVRGVAEGMVSAEDAFPTAETADEINNERAADDAALKKREGRTVKPKAEPKQEAAKTATVTEQPSAQYADDMIEKLGAAVDFDTIQKLRGAYAAAGLDDADLKRCIGAYEVAMARVKKANAAKAKPADETRDEAIARHRTEDAAVADQQQAGADEFDEEAALEQIDEMFADLDVPADVETTRDSLVAVIGKLSESGVKRATMAYNTAQQRAKAKAAEVVPGPSTSTQLFGDE